MKNLYVIFNYYLPNSLDNFCMLAVCESKNEAMSSLAEEAMWRVTNCQGLENTLVCYLIDPEDYDLTASDFIKAAEDPYSSGQDLHYDHTDVVYALSSMVRDSSEVPLYKLKVSDIETDFYEAYFGTFYDNNFDEYIKDSGFKTFVTNKIKTDVSKSF